MKLNDLYQSITDTILAELEAGAAPWKKEWSGQGFGAMPANAVTGRAYSGINVILLWIAQDKAGHPTGRWLTFKQAKAAGGSVRKGEKGTGVVLVSAIEKEEANDAGDLETRRIPFLKRFTVFNVAQCDGLPASITTADAAPVPTNTDARIDTADAFLTATGADITEGHGEAYYRPGADQIALPAFASFTGAAAFYGTAFHELMHWTGHKSRLDRNMKSRFGDRAYAAEELVAELGAAFLCGEFGLHGQLRHAGYIGHWIELLKADNRAIVTAASKAQQAADHLRALALAEPVAEAA